MTKRRSRWPKVRNIFRRAKGKNHQVPEKEATDPSRSLMQRCRSLLFCCYPSQVHPDMNSEANVDNGSGNNTLSMHSSSVMSFVSDKSDSSRNPSPAKSAFSGKVGRNPSPVKSLFSEKVGRNPSPAMSFVSDKVGFRRSPPLKRKEEGFVDLNAIDVEEQSRILMAIKDRQREELSADVAKLLLRLSTVPGPSDPTRAFRAGKSDGHLEAKITEQDEQKKEEEEEELDLLSDNKPSGWYFPKMKDESKYIKSMEKADAVRRRRELDAQINQQSDLMVQAAISVAVNVLTLVV